MPSYNKNNMLYGVGKGIIHQQDRFIIASRAPRPQDTADPGYLWLDTAGKDAYLSFKGTSGLTDWVSIYGNDGLFANLTVTTNADIQGILKSSALGAGTIMSDATGAFSELAHGTSGQVLIGSVGVAPVWANITAGGGIAITEGAGALTITDTGATGTTLTTDDAIAVGPDVAGNTNIVGFDANITTDGATANTVRVKLADDIVSVASLTATNDFTMGAGTFTVTSDDNAANAIYIHADAGVNETIKIYSDQGTGNDSIYALSDVGGVYLSGGLATVQAINIIASDAAGGMTLGAGTAGIATTIVNGDYTLATGTGNISIGADVTDHDVEIGDAAGVNAMSLISGTGSTAMTSTGDITLDAAGVVEINSSAGAIGIGNDAVAQNINIGTGAAARAISIGNADAGVSITADPALNIKLDADGNVDIVADTGTAAAAAVTLNKRIGIFTATGLTTAAGASQQFTITNSEVLVTSGLIVTVGNKSAGNDCKMQMDACTPAAGSFTVDTTNVGAAALDSDVIISWIILN